MHLYICKEKNMIYPDWPESNLRKNIQGELLEG